MVVCCAIKAVTPATIEARRNVQSIAKTGVGAYTVTLASTTPPSGYPAMSDGFVIATISGPYKIDAEFASASTIAVQILSLTTGAAADPPAGTRIKVVALH